MPLTPEKRALALAATREAAAAFVEDMDYIRGFLNQDRPLPRDIRHLSAIMRRLLVDGSGDLRAIAPPRIDRLEFEAPDNSLFYGKFSFHLITFFSSGGPNVFGTEFRALTQGGPTELKNRGFDKKRTIPLSLDSFLQQRVILFQHQWVTRQEVIKYVANIASGVHSGVAKKPVDLMLERVRRYVRLTPVEGTTAFKVEFDPNAALRPDIQPYTQWSSTTIDTVQIELRAAAYYLSRSAKVLELERMIRLELGPPDDQASSIA